MIPHLERHENGTFYYHRKVNGNRIRKSLRTKDEAKAKVLVEEMDARLTLGILGLPVKRITHTLQQLFDEYLPYCKKHKSERTYRDAEMHVRLFLGPALGHIPTSELDSKHIEDFVGQMKSTIIDQSTDRRYHPRTINLRLETLRKILNRAVENKIIPTMPCKISLVKEPDSLPKYSPPDQIAEWMQYLGTDSRMRALLSFMTGITDRDLGFVRVDGYDRYNAQILFRRPKTETDIVVPLTPIGIKIMDALVKNNPGPMLFSTASTRKAFSTASKNSGKKITPHMLRHSFATWLLSNGAPLSFVQQILGHKSSRTTERYARVMPNHLREFMGKIEASFDIEAILIAPRKDDGRTAGIRCIEDQKQAQAERMRGNKRRKKEKAA